MLPTILGYVSGARNARYANIPRSNPVYSQLSLELRILSHGLALNAELSSQDSRLEHPSMPLTLTTRPH